MTDGINQSTFRCVDYLFMRIEAGPYVTLKIQCGSSEVANRLSKTAADFIIMYRVATIQSKLTNGFKSNVC